MRKFCLLPLILVCCLGARKFVGTNYYNCARSVATAAPLTLSCWFFLYNTNNSQPLITLNAAVMDRFGLSVSTSGKVNALAAQGSTNGTATSVSVTTTNAWHHVAGVYNSSASRVLYLDGVPVATNTTTVVPQSIDRFLIAGRVLSSVVDTNYFGEIAEVAVWKTNLTAAEILVVANNFKQPRIQLSWLSFYSPLMSDSTVQETEYMGATALLPTNAPVHVSRHPIVR